MPLVTKPSRVITHNKKLLSVKSEDTLITLPNSKLKIITSTMAKVTKVSSVVT